MMILSCYLVKTICSFYNFFVYQKWDKFTCIQCNFIVLIYNDILPSSYGFMGRK